MLFDKEKKGKIRLYAVRTFFAAYICLLALVAGAGFVVPDEITLTRDEFYKVSANAENVDATALADAKLFGVLPIKNVKVNVIEENKLVPCGEVFGVKFFTKGVLVVKLSDIETKDGRISPAETAGLKVGDIIEKISGKEINTIEEMAKIIEASGGNDLVIVYRRDGKQERCVLSPCLSLSDKKYKTGIWVRDSTAGIGTMTYYNKSTGEFAGLGHGICDVDTGLLMPLLEASVVDVRVNDIIKGRRGTPGELKGIFDSVKRGSITKNTERGIFGFIDKKFMGDREEYEIGLKDELQLGQAEIMCQLDSGNVRKYSVSITKIHGENDPDKNFVIEVTDESLLEKTGGIVQGMSGSPIIQNGKLVGAVTHVLVNNPKKGYGIYIENMLKKD